MLPKRSQVGKTRRFEDIRQVYWSLWTHSVAALAVHDGPRLFMARQTWDWNE